MSGPSKKLSGAERRKLSKVQKDKEDKVLQKVPSIKTFLTLVPPKEGMSKDDGDGIAIAGQEKSLPGAGDPDESNSQLAGQGHSPGPVENDPGIGAIRIRT